MLLKLFEAIKNYFQQRDIHWVNTLNELGFHKVLFPILLKEGLDIDIVWTLQDFAADPDLYSHEFDERNTFIDLKGNQWTYKYDSQNRINLPDKITEILSLNEIKEIIKDYFRNTKIEEEINTLISRASTIEEVFTVIADKL